MYFTQKYITYLIEIKEENSSNILFITLNESRYFKNWSPFQSPPRKVILYRCLKFTLYWCLFLKQTSNALRGTHILYFWNLSFNENPFSKTRVDTKHCNYYILDCNVSWISKPKDKQHLQIALSQQPLLFWGQKFSPQMFWKIGRTPNPSHLYSGGDPAVINQNYLIYCRLVRREIQIERYKGRGKNSRR